MKTIIKVVLAVAVLLTISWPAAAQERVEGTVARLELNSTPVASIVSVEEATEAEAHDEAEAQETDGASDAPVAVVITVDGPFGPALSTWGSRIHGLEPKVVRTVTPKMSRPSR